MKTHEKGILVNNEMLNHESESYNYEYWIYLCIMKIHGSEGPATENYVET